MVATPLHPEDPTTDTQKKITPEAENLEKKHVVTGTRSAW